MRYFLAIFVLTIGAVYLIAGKQGDTSRKPPIEIFDDMVRQAKFRPQQPNNFFANGRTSQRFVAGTVARGSRYEENEINTGKVPGTTNFVDVIPVEVNESLMARGRDRYAISCKICHGALADGNGVTKKFGMSVVATLHDPRIVGLTDGELFNTITHGKNLMGGYGSNISVSDRWAIVAYVRALQRSRLGIPADVPAEVQSDFK
jgi:mono/diheme cytochrome c family protein